MNKESKEIRYCILVADDDPDDQYMIREALSSSGSDRDICMVSDGEELLEFLTGTGKYKGKDLPVPLVILLDLNMPKKDGRECLREIKSTPGLKRIPIVVFSTSNNREDVTYSYEAGAASYITKPYSYNELVATMEIFKQYWFKTVKTPGQIT
ncbi:MAG TPA: response regulator [Bacteroidia bacterium]|jgi:CheY-like chemotaxis protein